MSRIVIIGLLVLAGCNRVPRQSAVEVAAFIANQYVDAAAQEHVKHIYLRVEGADSSDVIKRAQRADREVTFLSGTYEFEVRKGRLREKTSDVPCYAIMIVLERVTAESASLRVHWTGSFWRHSSYEILS